VPGARYHELKDAAHGVPITRAGEVNALLREHLVRSESSLCPVLPLENEKKNGPSSAADLPA
jgi:hypothetical protein